MEKFWSGKNSSDPKQTAYKVPMLVSFKMHFLIPSHKDSQENIHNVNAIRCQDLIYRLFSTSIQHIKFKLQNRQLCNESTENISKNQRSKSIIWAFNLWRLDYNFLFGVLGADHDTYCKLWGGFG